MLLEETKKYLDDNERITFNGFDLIVSSENSNRYISEPHMDALLLADTCDDIYATNEFQKYVAHTVRENDDEEAEISKTKIKISLDKYHKNKREGSTHVIVIIQHKLTFNGITYKVEVSAAHLL